MGNVSSLAGLTYHVKTFGCQMNLHDSERVSGLLGSCGCLEVATPDEADIVVFMTCCVREKADTHLYGQVSAMVSAPEPPHGRRVVCIGGCIAQRDGSGIREHMRNVDVVFGTRAIASLPDLIVDALNGSKKNVFADTSEDDPGFSSDLPSRREDVWHAWVPIMTGCNNFCSYCIVPYVRGRERDRAFESIVDEVRTLHEDGVREVCLLGQNVNSFGRQRYGSPRFAELLRAVGETGIERIRFTSSHPKDLSDETIAAMAETPAVMPQLHLAVQSGSTRVLKAMNRHYTREDYLALADRIKRANPGIALSTDIIVGFPGETEEDFQKTLELVQKVGYMQLFTFIYSKRTGTKAAEMPDPTPRKEKTDRMTRLLATQDEIAMALVKAQVGQTVRVLVEGFGRNEGTLSGRLDNNLTVEFAADPALLGSYATVHLTGARATVLLGELEA